MLTIKIYTQKNNLLTGVELVFIEFFSFLPMHHDAANFCLKFKNSKWHRPRERKLLAIYFFHHYNCILCKVQCVGKGQNKLKFKCTWCN